MAYEKILLHLNFLANRFKEKQACAGCARELDEVSELVLDLGTFITSMLLETLLTRKIPDQKLPFVITVPATLMAETPVETFRNQLRATRKKLEARLTT